MTLRWSVLIVVSLVVLVPACGGDDERASEPPREKEAERPIVVVNVKEPHPAGGPTVKVAGTVDPSGAEVTVAGRRAQIKDGRFRAIVTGLKPDERREVPLVARRAGYRTNHTVVRVSRNPSSQQLRAADREQQAINEEVEKLQQEEAADDGAGGPNCREPSGQEKFSLRFQVRAHNRELKDEPWALVRGGDTNYMAAEIDTSDPRLVVLVSFPEKGAYLSGMKAVNGTARTFTNLPVAGDQIPTAGDQALACVDGG